jgi:salicylate hydroxylase
MVSYTGRDITRIAKGLMKLAGIRSVVRERLLGRPSPPLETGDPAYRGTLLRNSVKSIDGPVIGERVETRGSQLWLGPDKYCVFYLLKNR